MQHHRFSGRALSSACLFACLLLAPAAAPATAETEKLPKGKALRKLVEKYLAADHAGRRTLREDMDKRFAPLEADQVKALKEDLLDAAARVGPRLERKSGTHYWFGKKEKKQGKYILRSKRGKPLFLGLHGGGVGSGDAESMAAGMGGGGWMWIFPEVLEKTERGWTDSGTEAWVVELIAAAKRGGKLDPNRVYISGHSMGGYGAWTIGAHHADLFAGIAPYAGAPIPIGRGGDINDIVAIVEGILPNVANVRLHVYQSGDDPQVPPGPNDFAMKELKEQWKKDFPELFDFRYDRVEGRAHAAPKEGYVPSQKWLAEHERNARPPHLLWQPVLGWKRQWYWLYWDRPEINALLEVQADREKNRIDIRTHAGSGEYGGLRLLLGEPLVDPTRPVTVLVDGKQVLEARPELRLSTLFLSLPDHDGPRMYAASLVLPD